MRAWVIIVALLAVGAVVALLAARGESAGPNSGDATAARTPRSGGGTLRGSAAGPAVEFEAMTADVTARSDAVSLDGGPNPDALHHPKAMRPIRDGIWLPPARPGLRPQKLREDLGLVRELLSKSDAAARRGDVRETRKQLGRAKFVIDTSRGGQPFFEKNGILVEGIERNLKQVSDQFGAVTAKDDD